jgi:hypothetical protein
MNGPKRQMDWCLRCFWSEHRIIIFQFQYIFLLIKYNFIYKWRNGISHYHLDMSHVMLNSGLSKPGQ